MNYIDIAFYVTVRLQLLSQSGLTERYCHFDMAILFFTCQFELVIQIFGRFRLNKANGNFRRVEGTITYNEEDNLSVNI